MIACVGWGSLIWNPKELRIDGGWRQDGPELPVEFARLSQGGNVTLVIASGVARVTTLWTELLYGTVEEAAKALQCREGSGPKGIGIWTARRPGTITKPGFTQVAEWAARHQFDAAVWTALPPKWVEESGRMPQVLEVVDYLRALEQPLRATAEQYVRMAPPQIRTLYRSAIERELGWTPIA
jgi:hypothetical protein